MQFAESTDFSKIKSFAEVDEKTGKIKVKDIDQLIDSGVVELFESDPYTNRVLEDRTNEIIGGRDFTPDGIKMVKSQVLREILEPYGSTGTVKSEDTKAFRNFSVPSSRGGSGSGSGDSDGVALANRFIGLYDETGYLAGEKQQYSLEMLKKRGYSEEKAKELIKNEASYVNSDAFKGKKAADGTRLGYIKDTKVNSKVVPSKGGVRHLYIEVYDKDDNKDHVPLTIDLMRNYYPKGTFDDFEAEMRRQGRIDENGIFINGANRSAFNKFKKQ